LPLKPDWRWRLAVGDETIYDDLLRAGPPEHREDNDNHDRAGSRRLNEWPHDGRHDRPRGAGL